MTAPPARAEKSASSSWSKPIKTPPGCTETYHSGRRSSVGWAGQTITDILCRGGYHPPGSVGRDDPGAPSVYRGALSRGAPARRPGLQGSAPRAPGIPAKHPGGGRNWGHWEGPGGVLQVCYIWPGGVDLWGGMVYYLSRGKGSHTALISLFYRILGLYGNSGLKF